MPFPPLSPHLPPVFVRWFRSFDSPSLFVVVALRFASLALSRFALALRARVHGAAAPFPFPFSMLSVRPHALAHLRVGWVPTQELQSLHAFQSPRAPQPASPAALPAAQPGITASSQVSTAVWKPAAPRKRVFCAPEAPPSSALRVRKRGAFAPVEHATLPTAPFGARFPFGPRLMATLHGEKAGSAEFQEKVKRANEAALTASFLKAHEPALWGDLTRGAGFTNPAACEDHVMVSFALAGYFKTARARRALVALRAWTRANAAEIDLKDGLTTAHLVMIATDSNINARSNGFDKDTSAASSVEALKDAVNLFGLVIPFARLNSSTLKAATNRGGVARALPVRKAALPLSALFFLEDVALGAHYEPARGSPPPPSLAGLPPEAVFFARSLWLAWVVSLRSVDVRRLRRATPTLPRRTRSSAPELPLPPGCDANGSFVDLVVTASKDGKTLYVRAPLEGLSPGVDRWALAHLAEVEELGFFFPAALFPRGHIGDICRATGFQSPARCCSSDHLTKCVFALLALPPFGLSSAARVAHGITGRSRSMLPEVAEVWAYDPTDAQVIGDWCPAAGAAAAGTSARQAAAAPPTCKEYGSKASLLRQLTVRRRPPAQHPGLRSRSPVDRGRTVANVAQHASLLCLPGGCGGGC